MKRVSLHFLFLLSALLLCASPALSQSVLVFPRVIAATGEYTGLAVSNPTPAAVSITFTAYQADGTMAAGTGVQNPVTLSIPAGGQLAKQYGEIFGGNGSFNGWVQASSASTGLTGYFLNGNTALTDLDGAATVGAASDLMLPIAIEDGVAETEVTIVNANSSAATATVTVYGLDGGVIQTTSVSVAGMGVIRQTLSSLMGAGDYSAASHIRIQSALPLNALDVVVNYLVDGSAIRRETVEVPGQPASSGESYILPQFVTGGGWLSLIGLANGGGVSQTVTLTAYQENGTLWPGLTANPVQVTLPANGGIRTTAAEMFGFPAGTLNTGWIQVQSPLGYLSAYVGYGNTTTPSFGLVPAAEASTAWKYGVFPQVAEGGGFFTGLTLVNPGQTAATINFYTMRPDGTTVGESTFTLGAGQRVGELFREVLPAALGQVGGWGYVRSSQPLVGVSLLGTENGYALANVPEQGAPADFQPAGQTTGAITGTVTANGQAVAGVEITLTGPVTATVTTDASGDYIFSQLPAGTYQVTAVEPGAQFVPAAISVTLTAQNVTGQNFVAGGLTTANAPVVNVLSPASVFAGTSTLNIRVLGGNFTPTSVVLLNGQALQTSFINAGELDAILPAAQLTTAQTVNLTVMTPPPGGGQSGTVGLVVNPVPNDPLIVGRAATGGNPAGVAVDAKRLHALVTNESSDTVSVIDLKTLTSVAAIGVGRSPAEGIAVDAARDIALVANPGTNDVSVIDLPTNTETKRISLGAGSFPLGIAIDDTVSRAFVADELLGTVSVIDLNTLAVVGTIAAGAEPSNVAVNTGTHMGLVTNRGSNTVTVFNTSTLAVTGQLNVGLQPRGIAVNPVTNQAVIANSNGNDVWVVDLAALTIVAKVTVGSGPTGIAVFPLTNTAIVTNSGVTKTQTNAGVQGSISIINLSTDTVSQQITVGASAFGIDVDMADQQVVVADYGSNDVTVVRIPNPVPQVTDVEPKTFPAGGGTFTITIMGTGFLPTSVVTVNGQTLPTTYVSSTELQAQVSPDELNQLAGSAIQQQSGKGQAFSATSSGFTIGVNNPGPGGGNSPPNPGSGQIQTMNAVPILLSISPTSITVGTGNLTLTLSGNNFNATSVVNFGGSQQSPTAVSATSMTVVIPQSSLSAGNISVSVTNPPPGGGTSTPAIPFQVNAQSNPAPSVTAVTPPSIQAGSAATVVTVQGSSFIGITTATLGGVTGTVSGQTATFNLSAAVLANPGTLAGLITTPAPGGGTATFAVNVLNGPPAVTGFAPNTAVAGTASITLSVAGTNFGSGSQVTVAGTPVPTTFVSSTALSGTVSAGFLLHAGTLSVGVTNPAPGGGTAAAANVFTVTAAAQAPTITGINPSTVTAGQGITVTGTNFVPASTVLLNGVPLPTTDNSTTQLTATIPAATAAGAAGITVQNPATSTTAVKTSAVFSITIVNPVPVVSSITPSSGTQNSQISLTVFGTNFVNGAAINFGGSPVTTTFINTGTLTASVVVPIAGTVNVSVTNPGGVTSNSIIFQSAAPAPMAPTVSGVSPSSAVTGSTTPITVTGTNFVAGSVINFNSASVGTTFVNSTTLTATVAVPLITGSIGVSVTNPGGAISNSVTFQSFAAPPPTMLTISPVGATQGQGNITITLTGANLAGTTAIQFLAGGSNDPVITVTGLNASTDGTQVTATANISGSATVGGDQISITRTGQTFILGGTFEIYGPGSPALYTISPSQGALGTGITGFTISGASLGNVTSLSFIPQIGASDSQIVINNFSAAANSITANLTIGSTALIGPHSIQLNTLSGPVFTGAVFNVSSAGGLTVNNLSPFLIHRGDTGTAFSLSGSNLGSVTGIGFYNPDGTQESSITSSGFAATSSGISANLTLDPNMAVGPRTIALNFAAGISLFTTLDITVESQVTQGSVYVTSFGPPNGLPGSSIPVNLTAGNPPGITGFEFQVSGNNDTALQISGFESNGSQSSATLNLNNTATPGPRTLVLLPNGGGALATNLMFTVLTSAIPSISSISPASAPLGATSLAATVTGTNLAGTTAVTFSGTGITATITAASATSLSISITVASGAATGPSDVTLTTSGGSATLPGAFTVTIPSVFTGNVTISGPLQLSGATTVNGNLLVTGSGVLDLNGQTLTVNGNFSTALSGVLKMVNASNLDCLTVNGNILFDGGSETGMLTAGVITASGNFTQSNLSSVPDSFAASGTNKVRFVGSGIQTVSMSTPGGTGQSHFQDVEIANVPPGEVVMPGNVMANGNLTVRASGILSGDGTLIVAGNVTTISGGTLGLQNLTVDGTLTSGSVVGSTAAITEYPTPNRNAYPDAIVTGPDGNLWFTEDETNKIGRITPAGVVTEFPIPSEESDPCGITAGPDGNLWFTEESANKIAKITPAGVITEFQIPTEESSPGGITVGPDGNLWFTEFDGNNIGKITPAGAITEFPIPSEDSDSGGIAAGPDGNLWFTEFDTNKIGKITPAGTITEFQVPTEDGDPCGITAGPDGNLWFTEYDGNKIGKITPAGTITEFSIPTSESNSIGITAGPDGNVWFTESATNQIGRITPAGAITEFPIPTADSAPLAITLGPDGNLWFVEGNSSQIAKLIVPATTTFTIGGPSGTFQGSFDGNVTITGTAQILGPTTINGNLLITSNGVLDLNGQTITVNGNFSTTLGGVLKMVNPSNLDCLRVSGNITFDGGSETGKLTAGVITANGNFTQSNVSSVPDSFAASGTNIVKFTGSGIEIVSMATPGGAGLSHFENIEIANVLPGQVSIPNNVQANGNVTLTSNAILSGLGTLTVAGNLSTLEGSTVSIQNLAIGGTLTTGSALGFTPTITQYPTAGEETTPVKITAGPDGNLWFTEQVEEENARIGTITTAGVATDFPLPAGVSEAYGIVSGPDGNLWFTEVNTSRIGKITTAGAVTEYPLTPESEPFGITVGPDNNLWFAEYGGNKIGKITTAGVITEYPIVSGSNGPYEIAKGADGNLWFSELTASQIGKITTAGVITEYPIPTSNSRPVGIAPGPDGNIWFTEVDGNKIGRITPAGAITEFPTPTRSSEPGGITAGPDGNLWFTETNQDKIGKITTGGVITELAIPNADGNEPAGITVGPDNNVWFAEANRNEIGKVTISNSTAVTISGPNATLQGTFNGDVTVTGGAQLLGATTINGNLVVTAGGLLDLNGESLIVNGDFSTTAGGTIKMVWSPDCLTVKGNILFNGGSETGLLTNGLIKSYGNFTQSNASNADSFASSGTTVRFAGSVNQTISMSTPGGTGNSHFQDLDIASGPGGQVTIAGLVQVNGNMALSTCNAILTGSGTLTVVGQVSQVTGSLIMVPPLTLNSPYTVPLSVNVMINSATPVGAYQFTIGFDSSVIQLTSGNVQGGMGAGFTAQPVTVNIDNNAGTVILNSFQTGNSPSGTFTVANLVFTPIALGTSSLSVTGVSVYDTAGNPLPAAVVSLSSNSILANRIP